MCKKTNDNLGVTFFCRKCQYLLRMKFEYLLRMKFEYLLRKMRVFVA